jgi:hypothetical protein
VAWLPLHSRLSQQQTAKGAGGRLEAPFPICQSPTPRRKLNDSPLAPLDERFGDLALIDLMREHEGLNLVVQD